MSTPRSSSAIGRRRGARGECECPGCYSRSPTASMASSGLAYISILVPCRPRASTLERSAFRRGFPTLSTAPLIDDGDDALPGVDVLLNLELPLIPCIGPLGEELHRALASEVDLLVRPAEVRRIPNEIGMGVDFTGGHPVLPAASDDLDVLLRHRLPSIPLPLFVQRSSRDPSSPAAPLTRQMQLRLVMPVVFNCVDARAAAGVGSAESATRKGDS